MKRITCGISNVSFRPTFEVRRYFLTRNEFQYVTNIILSLREYQEALVLMKGLIFQDIFPTVLIACIGYSFGLSHSYCLKLVFQDILVISSVVSTVNSTRCRFDKIYSVVIYP